MWWEASSVQNLSTGDKGEMLGVKGKVLGARQGRSRLAQAQGHTGQGWRAGRAGACSQRAYSAGRGHE